MKISALKRRADALAGEARAHRLESRVHAKRSLSILRRRAGSPAGLGISFALGLLAGIRSRRRGRNARGRAVAGSKRGSLYRLARSPIGEAAMKLASALIASFTMKYLEARRAEEEQAAASGAAPAH